MKHAPPVRIFGPVPSRRLGSSLGVDVVPRKTCTLDCLYCQLGPTKRTTVSRRRYVPSAEVLRQLRERLEGGCAAAWITFSGSGEPTLHSGLGGMIRAAKRMTRIPVAVLTNGTLLSDPRVRRDLLAADLVVPDLDAGSARVFRRMNRPHPSLSFRRVVEGIAAFVREFPGRVWLEVVLLKGVNDGAAELRRIGAIAARIRPERVQLNTAARPPAYASARPLGAAELRAARRVLASQCRGIPVEIVADRPRRSAPARRGPAGRTILAYLARRPGTLRDLVAGLGAGASIVAPAIARLLGEGKIAAEEFGGKRYYRAARVSRRALPPRPRRGGGSTRPA